MSVQKLVKYEQSFECKGCPEEAMFKVTVGDQVVERKAISCLTPTEFVVPDGAHATISLEFENGDACVREIVSGAESAPEGCFGELILLSEMQVEL